MPEEPVDLEAIERALRGEPGMDHAYELIRWADRYGPTLLRIAKAQRSALAWIEEYRVRVDESPQGAVYRIKLRARDALALTRAAPGDKEKG